jgi:hypothetical protein
MKRAFVLGARAGAVVTVVLFGAAAALGWLLDQMDKAEIGEL